MSKEKFAQFRQSPAEAKALVSKVVADSSFGRYHEAKELLLQALAIQEKELGVEHPEICITLQWLALLYQKQKQFSEAESLLQKVRSVREKVLGHTHTETAASLTMLANLYAEEAKYAEAEPLYHQALAIQKELKGLEDAGTVAILNNLAFCYLHQKKYGKADTLFSNVLKIREKAVKSHQVEVIQNIRNLAIVRLHQEKYGEARKLLEKAVAIQELDLSEYPSADDKMILQLFGSNSDTEDKIRKGKEQALAKNLRDLGNVCRKQFSYSEAFRSFEKALALDENTLGPCHLDLLPIGLTQLLGG